MACFARLELFRCSHINHVHAMCPCAPPCRYAATKMFVSNLNARLAQRFLALVLLPRVRRDIAEHKRLHFALFQSLKKATYKPGAFYKVGPWQLITDGCVRRCVFFSLDFSPMLGQFCRRRTQHAQDTLVISASGRMPQRDTCGVAGVANCCSLCALNPAFVISPCLSLLFTASTGAIAAVGWQRHLHHQRGCHSQQCHQPLQPACAAQCCCAAAPGPDAVQWSDQLLHTHPAGQKVCTATQGEADSAEFGMEPSSHC